MISPLEIQEKEFGRGLKGFKEDEVNEFLDQLTLDLERLLEENRQLKAEKQQMEEELKKFKESETSVLETLETAKALMGDISASAEKRAQILLKNAELDAQRIQREAREEAERMNEENAALHSRVAGLRQKFRQLLESELERFDTLSTELFPELGVEDLDELPEAKPQNGKPAFRADEKRKTIVHVK
ncbi:MAG: DivIVA domain-containing protein [Firmicutes bacterium]|nr:DivIVA domain-containing protein [Bacillota bacterium]